MQTLPSITTPSLLLHGGDDDICYPAGSQEMHDKLGSKQKTLTVKNCCCCYLNL
jgi:pimeloyl-ACP methyl ester carboxylesterase